MEFRETIKATKFKVEKIAIAFYYRSDNLVLRVVFNFHDQPDAQCITPDI